MGAIVMRGRDADYSAGSIVRTGICPVGIGPGSGTVAICFEWHDVPSLGNIIMSRSWRLFNCPLFPRGMMREFP